MPEQRIPHRGLTVFGIIGFAAAMIAAGCSKGSGSSSAVTPNLTSPTPGAVCASGSGGVAYVTDGGSGGPTGITILPFETTSGQFTTGCAAKFLTTGTSVSALSISTAGNGAAIATSGLSVVGLGGFISGGAPFLSQFTQTATTPLTSLQVLPAGTFALAVDNEAPAPGPTAGFIGVNNLLGLAPTPGPTVAPGVSPTPTPTVAPNATATAFDPAIVNPAQVSYTSIGVNPSASPIVPSSALAIPSGSVVGRPSIALGPDGETILVRGDKDLIAFAITPTAAGYFLIYPEAGNTTPITGTAIGTGQSLSLAYPAGLSGGNYGRGLIAFAPNTAARALIGGNSSSPDVISLINQIPNNLTPASSLTLSAPVTSVAISPSGNYAAVGTTNGIVIVGVGSGTLGTVQQTVFTASPITFARTDTGASTPLAKIVSVAFSADGGYVLALADDGDNTASLVAFYIDGNGVLHAPATVTAPATPAPVAIGSPIPEPKGDYLVTH